MNESEVYLLLADTILIVHLLLVAFVVFGFIAILAGRWLEWRWIYRRTFRIAHLAVVGIIVLQAWLGRLCPLTILESYLRSTAGVPGYTETFIQHWLHRVLFYAAPMWMFAVIYLVFGVLVLALFISDFRRQE